MSEPLNWGGQVARVSGDRGTSESDRGERGSRSGPGAEQGGEHCWPPTAGMAWLLRHAGLLPELRQGGCLAGQLIARGLTAQRSEDIRHGLQSRRGAHRQLRSREQRRYRQVLR